MPEGEGERPGDSWLESESEREKGKKSQKRDSENLGGLCSEGVRIKKSGIMLSAEGW